VRTVECLRKDDGSNVGDYLCEGAVSIPAVVQACNTQACPQRCVYILFSRYFHSTPLRKKGACMFVVSPPH
jgi:hypothetical protein